MTSDGTHTYEWDAEDRMVSVDGGSTATQKYNSLGQRVERFRLKAQSEKFLSQWGKG